MKYLFTHKENQGQVRLIFGESTVEQNYFDQEPGFTFHTLVWNKGPAQKISIDEIQYVFEENAVLPIMHNQSFFFEHAEHLIVWQFNREFYCIINHDAEVGCVGFIFFGPSPTMFVKLNNEDADMFDRLLTVFKEEFLSEEDIKGEMLRMLLVQLIIKITRLAKKQYLGMAEVVEEKFNIIRQFNLLVEMHFRNERQVAFYAGKLNKSPKTIANYFSLYSNKTALQVIQERVITEAKRLIYYSDKSVKEIAHDLGFSDVGHFSKYIKSSTSKSPSELRKLKPNGN